MWGWYHRYSGMQAEADQPVGPEEKPHTAECLSHGGNRFMERKVGQEPEKPQVNPTQTAGWTFLSRK